MVSYIILYYIYICDDYVSIQFIRERRLVGGEDIGKSKYIPMADRAGAEGMTGSKSGRDGKHIGF